MSKTLYTLYIMSKITFNQNNFTTNKLLFILFTSKFFSFFYTKCSMTCYKLFDRTISGVNTYKWRRGDGGSIPLKQCKCVKK